MRILFSGFSGAVKGKDAKLLPDSACTESLNQHPGEGNLRPWRVPLEVATVPSGRKTIYRLGRDVFNASLYWLSFTTVVHAVRGFIASDTTERTYLTGSGAPKVTDNTIGLASAPYPTAARDLGVPRPTTGFTITQDTAGTGDDENRKYVQTWVTDRGEESAPGPLVAFTAKPGAVLDITDIPAPPAGNHGITLTRLYRTQPTDDGDGEFFMFREISSTATTTTDPGTELGADVLVTNGWFEPPADLKCLTGMWDGMMAGISGRSVRYCEPYKPYAWPIAYETLPPDVTPVALAVWAKNLLVLTNGRPYLVQGQSPEALADDPIDFEQACVSPTSPANVGLGVAWAAPDGLAYYGSDGPRLVTAGLISRNQWQAMRPETIVGARYEGLYVGFYSPATNVWKGFFIDCMQPTGVYFLETGYPAVYFDKLVDALFVLDGTSVKQWGAGEALMTAKAVSKIYRTPRPVNIGYLEVTADHAAFPVAVKLTGSWTDAQGVARSVVQERSVASGDPISLRGDFMADHWQIEVTTAGGAVQGIAAATSKLELAAT